MVRNNPPEKYCSLPIFDFVRCGSPGSHPGLLAWKKALRVAQPSPEMGRSNAGFRSKKSNGLSWNSVQIVGVTGQSSARGAW